MNRLSLEQKDKLEFADYKQFIIDIQSQAIESYNDEQFDSFDLWLSKQQLKILSGKLSLWEKLSK